MPRKSLRRGPRRRVIPVSAGDCLTMEVGVHRREVEEYERLRELWPHTRHHYPSFIELWWWLAPAAGHDSEAGTRPWAWWEWSSPQPRDERLPEWQQLCAMGELTPHEVEVLTARGLNLDNKKFQISSHAKKR